MKKNQTLALIIFLAVCVQPILFSFLWAPSMGLTSSYHSIAVKGNVSIDGIAPTISTKPSTKDLVSFIHSSSLSHQKAPMQTRDWTVLVYLDGDNNLEEAAFDDFNAMETIGSTAEVNIIVGVDFYYGTDAPFTDGRIYNITYDTNLNIINSQLLTAWGEPNMGSPSTLWDFINFGQSVAPADNYLLVLWDHGGGFYGVCVDDTDYDELNSEEISSVLASFGNIDVVAFDACLMAQLEVAYELRYDTDFLVFSEAGIPLTGFPYEDSFNYLISNPTATPGQVADRIATDYNAAYSMGGRYYDPLVNDICISSVNANNLGTVATALNTLTQHLVSPTILEDNYEALCQARGNSQSFDSPDFMDLGAFAAQVDLAIADPTISNYANALLSAVTSAVRTEAHLSALPGATGLGIAFSTHGYYSLELITDTNYDSFITDFFDIGSSELSCVDITDEGEHYGYLDGTSDEVHYSFTASSSTTYMISLESMQIYDEDFDLFLYDESWNLITSSAGGDSFEQVSAYLTSGETYHLRVYSYPSASYGLGAFKLTFPGGGPVIQIPFLLILLAILVIIIVVVVIVVVVVVVYWRSRVPTAPPPSAPYAPIKTEFPAEPAIPPPSPDDLPQFCTNCGAKLAPGAEFCPYCGSRR